MGWKLSEKLKGLDVIISIAALVVSSLTLWFMIELNNKVYNLSETIYNIEHPEPDIDIIEIKDVIFRPLHPFWKAHDNTSDFIGPLNLEIEVSVSTKHNVKFVIPTSEFYLDVTDNQTAKEVGYDLKSDVSRENNYTQPIGAISDIITLNCSFDIDLGFSKGTLRTQYHNQSKYIGVDLFFLLEYHDLQTSKKYSLEPQKARIVWNDQTSLN